jgi:glyoxylase-like metal-dependent hydrolase (beta-lactamase superfamily II)
MKESVFWLFLRDARIAEITDKPITHFIYSHAHTDHIGGANTVVEAFPSVRTRVGRCHIKGLRKTCISTSAANGSS